MVDGIIKRLRSYNDATLRQDIGDNSEQMLALVMEYFHCG
jgi:glutamine synthetase